MLKAKEIMTDIAIITSIVGAPYLLWLLFALYLNLGVWILN